MKYQKHSKEFKSRIALEAIQGNKTISEISQEYVIHPNQITRWKQEALVNFPKIFDKNNESRTELKQVKSQLDIALKKLGQTTIEAEWLKKKLEPYK